MNEKRHTEDPEAMKRHALGMTTHTKEETRVWRGNYARQGFIYLVVKYKDGKRKYTNFALVPLHGTEEQKEQVYEALWTQLKNKFKL